eukprot:TRINITY_DN2388_c0_g1_i3.p1 TRINITY_DN2388_c0_g1~~TRINITY_DN2388_c0_g1_i3.p1  ORF type:complete len:229 (+),score=45.35 TRINITY_DN2388_c0_g1_i3:70-756(+)
MRVDGKVFVVTGASSGLGLATAQILVGGGASVALLDRDSDDLSKFESLGQSARFYAVDVTEEESVKSALAAAVRDFHQIHGVINCAGVASAEKVYTPSRGAQSLQNFEYVIRVNLIGTFNMIRLATEYMAKQDPVSDDGERGIIINVASVAAFDGQNGQVAYSASKGAIVSMTLPLARELGAFGIRVVTIAPGTFHILFHHHNQRRVLAIYLLIMLLSIFLPPPDGTS